MENQDRLALMFTDAAAAAGWQTDGRHAVVPTRGGRHQRVLAEPVQDSDAAFVRLCSVVGDAAVMNEVRLASALRMNARLCAGALAIDGGSVVLVEVLPLAQTDADTLRDAVARLAGKADELEAGLFGVDAQ